MELKARLKLSKKVGKIAIKSLAKAIKRSSEKIQKLRTSSRLLLLEDEGTPTVALCSIPRLLVVTSVWASTLGGGGGQRHGSSYQKR
jgi:hypothetical protein